MTLLESCLSLLGYCEIEIECWKCIAAQQLLAPADTTTLRGVKQAALAYTRHVESSRTHFHYECMRHPMCVSGAVSTPPSPHCTPAKLNEIHSILQKIIGEKQNHNLTPQYLFFALSSFSPTTLIQSRVACPDGFPNFCHDLQTFSSFEWTPLV